METKEYIWLLDIILQLLFLYIEFIIIIKFIINWFIFIVFAVDEGLTQLVLVVKLIITFRVNIKN